MRFTTAWENVLTQNITLRIVIVALSAASITALVSATILSLKEPIVIERGCFSVSAKKDSNQRTGAEIKSFIQEALHQRFDSGTELRNYLSDLEQKNTESEQKEFSTKEMRQTIIVNSVPKIEGSQVTVDVDRIIAVKDIRSAFSFPLLATIETVRRSETNPYGLILTGIKQLETKNEEKK